MSLLDIIKKTDPNTTTFIKNILNINDNNITFPVYEDAFSVEEVYSAHSKVFV